jgi:outer membrane protein
LTRSAKYHAQAAEQNAQATREEILLEVDGAYYSALAAQAVTRVAQETVNTRQVLLQQVSAQATNQLKSALDVSFSQVNLEEAQLLLSKARNDVQAAFAQLSAVLGLAETHSYQLIEQPLPPPVSTNLADFVQQGLRSRPDLLRYRDEQQAELSFAHAERAARFPTIAAVGAAGASPIHDEQIPDSYAAAGLTLTLPLYAGGLYAARQKEAELRAQAAAETLRDLENNVIRDVRVAWLNSQNAYERYRIAGDLLANARRSLDLAQARFNAQLSSIVELNQAELNEIQAEITYANTQYEYLLQRSTLSFQTGTLK